MKKVLFLSLAASSLVAIALMVGCENGWSTNDAGFNSSEGAGAQINFSGYYQGLNGGRAVANTSAGNIMNLTIQQAGDTVEVTDNQGSTYRGKIGSPGAVSPSSSGNYSAGAQLAQAQINFSGHDNVSGKDITFAGVLHAVAIEDIISSQSSDQNGVTTTETSNDGTTSNIITMVTVGTPSDPFYKTVTTTITYDLQTGKEIKRTVTTTGTTQYSITEANTQYRLQGTWVESAGLTSNLDALSPASAGLITVTTSSTQ